ncbi:Uncharacterized protein TCAP_04557 [Tolypocladium capitatum]|uniref:Sulfatase N-terminal domain-containing protein n=1 Tax=Tolypocladium capitatum TaxID=45235 RepID=A0A2K3QD94_9HYPO|nr:Uncharacterized protein TCAP_04557 [Tolypocladium capitatum]
MCLPGLPGSSTTAQGSANAGNLGERAASHSACSNGPRTPHLDGFELTQQVTESSALCGALPRGKQEEDQLNSISYSCAPRHDRGRSTAPSSHSTPVSSFLRAPCPTPLAAGRAPYLPTEQGGCGTRPPRSRTTTGPSTKKSASNASLPQPPRAAAASHESPGAGLVLRSSCWADQPTRRRPVTADRQTDASRLHRWHWHTTPRPADALFPTMASRFSGRRLALAIASRFANRRFLFSTAAVSVVGAKLVHIYAHLSALPTAHVLLWGYSFFAQDTALLLFVRLLLDRLLLATGNWLPVVATAAAATIVAYVLALGAVNISFFAVTGSEIHWRNIAFATDASSRAVLLAGLFSCATVLCTLLSVSWVLQDPLYFVAGLGADIVRWPFAFLLRKLSVLRSQPLDVKYTNIPQQDVERAAKSRPLEDHGFDQVEEDCAGLGIGGQPSTWRWQLMLLLYLLSSVALLAQFILSIVRPKDSAMVFMSWTPALLPFVDFTFSSTNLDSLVPLYHTSIGHSWDNLTALGEPMPLTWLPEETPLHGFEDWYNANKKHYGAASDPQKISNWEDDLLPELRNKLADVPIRNIMLVVLESTRKDVFPIKKEGLIWDTFAESFENRSLPKEAQERLATLTPTANFLTGDYDDGFEHRPPKNKRRGGISANNAHTTGTYTLKSLVGTICGLSPLVADFNLEYSHHIYQPCLPHILQAFNALGHAVGKAKDDFTTLKWNSSFFQSVTIDYDRQNVLMRDMGFDADRLISKEYLKSARARFGTVHEPDINYFGMPEVTLEEYIRDAFSSAKRNDERVFLTHLTSTSHHPFSFPDSKTYEYVPLSHDKRLGDLSHYTNGIGYADRWLGKILDILDEEGVADETLMVFVGDHGLSIPENDGISPYYNPNVGNFHVPMVFSHPKLPPLDINAAVSSLQILPTILDLLLETGSLPKTGRHREAARDLAHNYEGQSLLRPLRNSSNHSDRGSQGNWQYTVVNSGRAMLAVRDGRRPSRRLIVPVIDNIEWRFTDLDSDPHEQEPVVSFGFSSLLHSVERRHGIEAAEWVEEAAFMARWWVEENSKRWRYGPYAG